MEIRMWHQPCQAICIRFLPSKQSNLYKILFPHNNIPIYVFLKNRKKKIEEYYYKPHNENEDIAYDI